MIDKETACRRITELIERFSLQIESYENDDYNETQTRRDFVDPFFDALGWDIDNRQGYSESNREVIHEDKIRVGGTTKVPDYAFRLGGGNRLFFVEAKKPSVNIKEADEPADQLRRYGWNSKLAISIVTNFKEFAVYDCTRKPSPSDKVSTGRLTYMTYLDYIQDKNNSRNGFDFIWNTFGKENVLKGGLEKFIKSDTYKKGVSTVDQEFLQLMDDWRTILATSVYRNNKHLAEDELNYVVQQTLDRIIFLRIAEDRGIEPSDSLKLATENGKFYKNLFKRFLRADEKYNSGLFNFDKDVISATISIDNSVIKTIIKDLYYPSPYNFSVIPVEILGSVYEQFLGKVIRLTAGGRVKIEEKPEVRKSGGVFYTPQYIVQYIVQKTVGKLIEGKTPKEVSRIKIVDPACGSGSFLLGAYQYLLDWHQDYYLKHAKPSKGRKNDPLTLTENLSTSEKKRILLNNIFGVDIDVNAVEVTKLSLLIKCMEGETEASIETIQRLFHEQVLPSIDDNIRAGNSLVDTDFYDNNFDFGDERKIKPFNWKRAFPNVFKQGGFDIVIGNPPYVAIDNIKRIEKDYFSSKYPYLKKRFDLFGLFVDNGLRLLDENGKLGVIIPMQFLRNSAFELLRKSILENNHIEILNYLGGHVFKNANNDTIILVVGKRRQNKKSAFIESTTTKTNIIENKIVVTDQYSFLKNVESIIDISTAEDKKVFDRINGQKLKIHQRFQVLQGIVSGLNEAYIYHKDNLPKIEKKLLKTFVFGSDFEKYSLRNPSFQIIYLNKNIDISDYPKTENILSPFKKTLKKRREVVKKSIPWYSLQWSRDQITFEKPKIMFQKIRNQKLLQRLVGTFDETNLYVGDGVIYLNSKTDNKDELKFLLAILNSTLYNFYYRRNFLDINLKIKYLENTSIIDYTEFDANQSKIFTKVVHLVDQLLKLNAEKSATKLPSAINQLDEKITYCENKINQIIYQLYHLTEEEIEVVENAEERQ